MKYYKYSMNIGKLNFICVILFIPLFLLIYMLDIYSYINLRFIVLYFSWMFLHEFLHGVGFSLNKGVDRRNIVYGACLENGIFYCMCKEMISKVGIIVSLLFPFFFMGIFPFFVGLIIDFPILILLSLFNIVGCIGDLVMFFSFLKLSDFNYLDLDDCTSFVLISKNDLSRCKLFGLNLTEIGNFSDLNRASDYKKITVSKLSGLIFILLMVALIMDLFI